MPKRHNSPTRQYMANSVRIVDNRELFSVVRDELLEGKSVRVAVRGQSMLPFFMSGSTIELRPIAKNDIRKYNVVLADAGRSFVVHRIIEVGDKCVTLLGDGNIIGTEVVEREKCLCTSLAALIFRSYEASSKLNGIWKILIDELF